MNRIIIIGNGFDLAHGLPTKYCDFIANYWKSYQNSACEDAFYKFVEGYHFGCKYTSLRQVLDHYHEKPTWITKSKSYILNSKLMIEVKNDFFHHLNLCKDDVGWVDIEIEYYKQLKAILQRERKTENHDVESLAKVTTLNDEILAIKKHFEDYLIKTVAPEIESHGFPIKRMPEIFSNEICMDFELKKFFKEFPSKYQIKNMKPFFDTQKSDFRLFKETCILNFNYTATFSKYYDSRYPWDIINIHGQIGNNINLGFGDEKDEYYNNIENLNENEYLKFMKSFQYLKNNNYKKLSDFMESNDYQVQILGHSCGLSDRTLLKALFENANCKSIKIYYHGSADKNNHTDLVQNISRHFSDKVQMRSKIVDESLCSALPQKIRN